MYVDSTTFGEKQTVVRGNITWSAMTGPRRGLNIKAKKVSRVLTPVRDLSCSVHDVRQSFEKSRQVRQCPQALAD